jgi:hypothetical protein
VQDAVRDVPAVEQSAEAREEGKKLEEMGNPKSETRNPNQVPMPE